jgi:beta-glucosidase
MEYKELIGAMTLEEKCSLLSGKNFWQSKAIERLHIPEMFLADGPHGIRMQAGSADQLGLNKSLPATCFPTASAVANSWNTALGEEVGRLLGEEAVAQRVNVLLGPGLNVKRNPLCGRNFEYFSEDPYLSGKMAAAYIRGIQSKGIAACPKHFASNNQELRRMAVDSVVDERTLREIYLTNFEIAVKEGRPLAIMSAYNKVNGAYAFENHHLLRDILVGEWGFQGIVVSDWGGGNDPVAGTIAGAHLEMPGTGGNTDIELVEAVKNGILNEKIVDERVAEYLQVLFAVQIPEDAEKTFDIAAHHDAARRAAEESIVLLKNDAPPDAPGTPILPLKQGTQVALIGDFAKMPRYQGAGSSTVNATQVECTVDCINESGLVLVGYEQGFIRTGAADNDRKAAACVLAKKAQVVLLYLGLDEISETEGLDRTGMSIGRNQIDLLTALHAVNPNIVVVLSCGSAVEIPWLSKCTALVHAALSGQAGASAVLNVLTGKVCPSGKLSETYPISYMDSPSSSYFPGRERSAEYRESIFVGYRYFDTAGVTPVFPFGYGLSYTTFTYSNIAVSPTVVTFTVTNTGSVTGAETAQVYIGKTESAIFRVSKELKGFTKVLLRPGESKTVEITLDDKAFRYFNIRTNRFEIEGGEYMVFVGASSADIRLSGTVTIQGTGAGLPYTASELPHYYSAAVRDVSDTEFATLLDHAIPPSLWDRNAPLKCNDAISQMSYAKSPVARLGYKILSDTKKRIESKGKPDLNLLYIYNMPFRGIAKMTGGAVNMKMVNAVLEIINGHFFKGLGHLVGAWFRKGKAVKPN